MLQGQRDLTTVGSMLLTELAPLVGAQRGAIYQAQTDGASVALKLLSAYADEVSNGYSAHLELGEGLIGQCARDARCMFITDMPGNVVPISSGLFRAPPRNAIVLPISFRSEEHTSELQSPDHLVSRLLLQKKTHSLPPPPSTS